MQSALVATLSRPDWWAVALAAFLVRGGLLVVLLPVVSLPSTAALMTGLAPTVERIAFGRPTLEGAVVAAIVVAGLAAALAIAGAAGSWLDLALVRDAAANDELELGWQPAQPSAWLALSVRLLAHVPSLLVLAYGVMRIAAVGYEEFTAPGETGGVPVVDRVVGRVPDVVALLVIAWLAGEAVGALAARRVAAGASTPSALVASVRQLLAPRGLATLGITSVVLLGMWIPFVLVAGRTWEHLRAYLLEGVPVVPLAAALVLFVGTWILGLAIIGAGLAWRATAWTAEVPPPR
jgi:hypothetical protein